MATIQDISYRHIPRQSKLFLDYLDQTPAAMRFYHHPPDIESLVDLAGSRLGEWPFPRKEIASILRRQNESYGGNSETLRRIDELEKPDSVAILTGQQVGLFTGPIYTIYKALTTVRLSEALIKLGIRAVPVFWMDTEDHDLQEVTHCTVLSHPASIRTIDYRTALFKEAPMPMLSVGSIPFPETIERVVHDYLSHLPESIRKRDVQSLLESTYRSDSTFAQSFARLMMQLLRGTGLIFFNPQDLEAKRLTSKVIRRALDNAQALHSALKQRDQELNAIGFHSQVSVAENSTVLFFRAEGERRALERRSSGFGLKNSDYTFSLQELLDYSDRSPELFSPNVLLRPLIQDHLFPTVAYVGGPAELAYFAQIEVLYTLFERPMPIVWPRNSFTLLDPEIAAQMDQWGVQVQDCFWGTQHLMEKVMQHSRFSETMAHIEELHNHLDRTLTEIRPEIQAIELPLAQALDTAKKKILHNVQHVKTQIIRLGGQQNSSHLNAAAVLANHCYPNQTLQERELNILHFLAHHGFSLLDIIHSAIEIGNFAHRVLRLKEEA
jgi:bacillithiol synthase